MSIKNCLLKVVHSNLSIESYPNKKSLIENHQSRVVNQKSSIRIIFLKKLFEVESADFNACLNWVRLT